MVITGPPPQLAQLWPEIEAAVARVYRADVATPCEPVEMPDGRTLWLKREDTSLVHSYKWRGAFNKLASVVETGWNGVVVAASAGNHAQGVALSAKALQVPAVVFMPRTTPLLKQQAVKRLGGVIGCKSSWKVIATIKPRKPHKPTWLKSMASTCTRLMTCKSSLGKRLWPVRFPNPSHPIWFY